jgi:tripartite-type tricarboxylate transporter receptor subunit TctC
LSETAAQDSVAGFYKGKQITIAVGTSPGSTASLYAQALVRHIGRYMPGTPSFIVQHVPGAGGLVAANKAYNNSPRDGTALVTTNSTISIEPLLGGKGAQFDALKFTWIGSTHVEHMTCVAWHNAAVKTLQDAFTKELMVGSYGAEGPSATFAKAANKLAGTRFIIITGYAGGPEALMAMERGEVEGFCAMGWSDLKLRHAEWLKEKKVNILFQMGLDKEVEILEVPSILDYAKTPVDREALELLFTPLGIGRPLYGPPGIPADRVEALRAALELTLKDPQFLADARHMGLDVRHVSGEAIQRLLQRIYASPKAVIDRAMTIAD